MFNLYIVSRVPIPTFNSTSKTVADEFDRFLAELVKPFFKNSKINLVYFAKIVIIL